LIDGLKKLKKTTRRIISIGIFAFRDF